MGRPDVDPLSMMTQPRPNPVPKRPRAGRLTRRKDVDEARKLTLSRSPAVRRSGPPRGAQFGHCGSNRKVVAAASSVTINWWPKRPYFVRYAASTLARSSGAPLPTSAMITSGSRPGTRMRAWGRSITCPNQPVVRRYQVRTYTPSSTQTTQIGTELQACRRYGDSRSGVHQTR